MPKEAARLFLEVKNVRVERLQAITEEDARAEGFAWERFASYWDTLYAKCGYSWENNPWVWVYEFMRIK
jgi:hypothetical protein